MYYESVESRPSMEAWTKRGFSSFFSSVSNNLLCQSGLNELISQKTWAADRIWCREDCQEKQFPSHC